MTTCKCCPKHGIKEDTRLGERVQFDTCDGVVICEIMTDKWSERDKVLDKVERAISHCPDRSFCLQKIEKLRSQQDKKTISLLEDSFR